MIENIALLVLTLVLAGLFLLIFGMRAQRGGAVALQQTRLRANRELYQQRQQELADEVAEGVLSEASLRTAKLDLDRRFLAENQELEQAVEAQKPINLTWLVVPFLLIAGAIYWLFGSWHLQAQADAALAQLPELGARALQNDQAQLTPEELDTFALGLRQKLARQPGDAVAWLVYGRVMLAQGQLEQAIAAMEKSYRLDSNRLGTLLSYSKLLVQTGDSQYLPQAARMLAKVLAQQPNNVDALSLVGFVAFEQGDWDAASAAWTQLLGQLSATDPRREVIATALADVQQRALAGEVRLQVTVALAPELQAQVPANATLFVYVRDPSGMAMPAAVKRQAYRAEQAEVVVQLSNADAMLADYKLSDLAQWQVYARISADDKIDAEAGDLQGSSPVLESQSQAIRVLVNEILN